MDEQCATCVAPRPDGPEELPVVDPEVRRRRMRRIAALVVAVWAVVVLVASTQHHEPDPEHAFLSVLADGTPVSYPCGPIGVVADPRGAPDDWQSQVDDAIAAVADASAYELVDVTDDADGRAGLPLVRVRWSDQDGDAALDGDVLGVGGSHVDATDPRHYAGGSVLLDTTGSGAYSSDDRQATLEHELGHVLGLDHVSSPHEIMSTGQRRLTDTYGPGDTIGLAQLHDASCAVPPND